MIQTVFTEDWEFRYPIIAAPMANVSHGQLARAVSEAGGLGMIGVGNKDSIEMIERECAVARGERFGIGLLAWVIETRPELLEASLAQKPFLISISFASVKPYADRLHKAGILLATQVQNRKAALDAEEAGADLIVAQGNEAGGHTGAVGTLPLLQVVLDAVKKTPVAAAGGIVSGPGLAAVLAAGAVAGWVGTAFLLSPEAAVTAEARLRIAAASETDTIHTAVFDRVNRLGWPPEFPGRALRNAFAEKWHGREAELMEQEDEIRRFRAGAERRDYDITSIFAGQAVGMVSQEKPAGAVVRDMGEGAEEALRRCKMKLHDASDGHSH